MQEIDKYFTEHPTTGRQGMTDHLKMIGYTVNIMEVRLEVYPDTIGSRTNKMGLETIYPKKCLSKGGKARHIHPYLLRNLSITHRNQVWSTDISYVPLEHGFMYLYAMIDVYSRYVLGWRLSRCKDIPNGCINRKKSLINCRIFGRNICFFYRIISAPK